MITLARTSDSMHYPLIVNDDGRDILAQYEWDWPGIAGSFGWDMTTVRGWVIGEVNVACEHDSTDGTVLCLGCGLPATTFIDAAYAWLIDNVGITAEDPGYFLDG